MAKKSVFRSFLPIIILLYVPYILLGELSLNVDMVDDNSVYRTTMSVIMSMINVLIVICLLSPPRLVFKKSKAGLIVIIWILWMFFQTLVSAPSIGRVFITYDYIVFWGLNFLLLYKIGYHNLLPKELVSRYFTILVIVTIIGYVFLYSQRINRFGIEIGGLNQSYYLLCILPWVFINAKSKYRFLCFFVIFVCVFLSMKRTSIGAIVAVAFVYALFSYKRKSIIFKLIVGLIVLGLFAAAAYYIDAKILDGAITGRFEQAEYDENGHRPLIWATVLGRYENSSLSLKWFGHGHNTVIDDCGLGWSAHNDFIETLYDYGIISLSIFILFLLSLLLELRFFLKNKDNTSFAMTYISALVMYFMIAGTSHMVLYPYYFCFITAAWGYCLGQILSQHVCIEKSKRFS